MITLHKHRFAFVLMSLSTIFIALAPLFLVASCTSLQQTPQEIQARETLRSMTRGDVLPAEDAVARIEKNFPNTTAGTLAKLVHARIRMNAKDYAGAASLIDDSSVRSFTNIGDYALWLKASALEQAGRRVEARAAYEKLARDFPSSLRARGALLHDVQMLIQDGQAAAVPALIDNLRRRDDAIMVNAEDASIELVKAKAYEQTGDTTRALAAYRRIYFYAPVSPEASEAGSAIARLGSSTAPANAEEADRRAMGLFSAHRFSEAYDAYTDALAKFPAAATRDSRAFRVIAAGNSRRFPEAAAALNQIPLAERAMAMMGLAVGYGRAKQWTQARDLAEEMRRSSTSPTATWRTLVQLGQIAENNKDDVNASYFYRAAVASFPGNSEVAPAQFYIAWAAHDAKNFTESSRLLTEHLALYAGNNSDFRGKAAYWAARDSERVGKLAEARAIYQGLLYRYDANWYGYLAKQRLDDLNRSGAPAKEFPSDSEIGKAVANLKTVTVAEETAGKNEDERIAKADQLNMIGTDDWALDELNTAAVSAPNSPRVNLAIAKIFRAKNDNVQALNYLKKSYPDYSQMKPEEMRPDEWDVFYPLQYWDLIKQESRARSLDPYQVAGLIRQETVFNPRAVSSARAYGLMQLVVPTAITTARRVGVDRSITMDSLFEPRLNIQLGTAYFKDQLDKYGRIEYVAAAYNAGPGRVVQWRASLPLQIDEWQEAVPFRETRLYIQGVVRNTLQYRRLYDENGNFRPEVGARAIYPSPNSSPSPADATIRIRRVFDEEEE
jgi:soluble lytic murein transglycosylase